ncbi:hypothetical protein [Zunongwangia sp. H14]|uniref:hypothetical protein n=1 Tax=Zunongwangia sp. H14 TaxID=3240792 RepID=UPI00356193B7
MYKLKYLLALLVLSSCEIENIEYRTPIVVTDEPSGILSGSAVLGGEALAEGGKDITEYGIVYAQSDLPTINDYKIIEGSRIGAFSKRYSGFQPNTSYFYRAFAINEIGVGYGQTFEFSTNSTSTCNFERDNYVKWPGGSINVTKLEKNQVTGSQMLDDGNLEFIASGYSSSLRIFIYFKEEDRNLPLSGQYTTINSFSRESEFSNGEAIFIIQDFGLGSLGGATAPEGLKFYIENNNGVVKFSFCDFKVSEDYILNGSFNYED